MNLAKSETEMHSRVGARHRERTKMNPEDGFMIKISES